MADFENTSAVPTAYMSPQQLQQAYLEALRGKKSGERGQVPIYSGGQAALHILGELGDQVQMRNLMKQSIDAQQANAPLPPSGGGDSGGGGPPAPAPAPSAPLPTDTSRAPPSGTQTAALGGEPPELSGAAPANAPDGNLFGFIKAHEGYKSTAYPDGKQWSIGWGSKANSKDEKIGLEEATVRLHKEVEQAGGSVQQFAPGAPDGVKRALADLTYNTGTKWMGSGLGKAVQAGDWKTAQELFKQYNHRDGQVLPGLTERRQAASQWFPGGAPAGKGAGPTYPTIPYTPVEGGAPSAAAGGQPGAPGAGPVPGGPPPGGAPAGSPGGAPPGSPASSAGTDPFGPRRGTFVTPTDLPGRPQRNWENIRSNWTRASPQDQKEYLETNGGRNPMSFDLPNGAGKIMYHPSDPASQMFYPKIDKEKSKDVSGNDREFEYVIDPKTGARQYRGGIAPPTAEEAIAGAGQLEGAKKKAAADVELATAGPIEGAKSQAAADVKMYGGIHAGITGAGDNAAQQAPNIKLLRQIAPDALTGTGTNATLALNRLAAKLGVDPGGAAPRELFNTLAKRILADQFSGMRNLAAEEGSPASRVFKSMLDIEEKANITETDSLEGVQAKLNMLEQAGKRAMHWADMADDYKEQHGKLGPGFMKALRKDISETEFTDILPKAKTPDAAASTGSSATGTVPPALSPQSLMRPPAGGGDNAAAGMGTTNPIAQALMTGDVPQANPDVAKNFNKANALGAVTGGVAGMLPLAPAAGRFVFGGHDANAAQWLARLMAGGGGEEGLKAIVKHLMGVK